MGFPTPIEQPGIPVFAVDSSVNILLEDGSTPLADGTYAIEIVKNNSDQVTSVKAILVMNEAYGIWTASDQSSVL